VGGTHLDETPYLRITPADAAGDVRWGLEPLVTMLDRAGRAVRRQFPDAVLSVGHLSRQGGGELERHRSHESGRDADVGFFVRSATGHPLAAAHFVPFRPDGTAVGWPGAYFDDAKNWALVAAMVADTEAHLTHVFVAAPLRARLLAYAEKMRVPSSVRVRAAELMQQPRGALPHDDHFHVRIGCPAHMTSCIENPPPRLHHHEEFAARGRRGALPKLPTATAAASGWALPASATPTARHAPPRPSAPAPSPSESEDADPTSEPDAPPASITAPMDDVDG
jgi:penicillin-insensitive murein endopeptidase